MLTLTRNSLTRTAATAATTTRRMQSSSSQAIRDKFNKSFSKSWLSDISTYPIMVILGVAATGCCAFMAYKVTSTPDVRMSSETKGKVVRDW